MPLGKKIEYKYKEHLENDNQNPLASVETLKYNENQNDELNSDIFELLKLNEEFATNPQNIIINRVYIVASSSQVPEVELYKSHLNNDFILLMFNINNFLLIELIAFTLKNNYIFKDIEINYYGSNDFFEEKLLKYFINLHSNQVKLKYFKIEGNITKYAYENAKETFSSLIDKIFNKIDEEVFSRKSNLLKTVKLKTTPWQGFKKGFNLGLLDFAPDCLKFSFFLFLIFPSLLRGIAVFVNHYLFPAKIKPYLQSKHEQLRTEGVKFLKDYTKSRFKNYEVVSIHKAAVFNRWLNSSEPKLSETPLTWWKKAINFAKISKDQILEYGRDKYFIILNYFGLINDVPNLEDIPAPEDISVENNKEEISFNILPKEVKSHILSFLYDQDEVKVIGEFPLNYQKLIQASIGPIFKRLIKENNTSEIER